MNNNKIKQLAGKDERCICWLIAAAAALLASKTNAS